MDVTMANERITPAVAAEYLKRNTNNYRKLSRAVVKRYAEDMKNGRWENNGEAICFDWNGILKNGQHRLAAICMANVPVDMCVIRGINPNVTAYDIGSVRTAQQISIAKGLTVDQVMICAVNLMFWLKNGRNNSKTETLAYCEKHEDELNRAWRCVLNGDKTIRRASFGLAVYLMLTAGKMPFYEMEVFANVFATRMSRGTDGYEISPVLVARRMFDERFQRGDVGTRKSQREQLDILVQAMNDLHKGKKRELNYKVEQPFSFEPLLKNM